MITGLPAPTSPAKSAAAPAPALLSTGMLPLPPTHIPPPAAQSNLWDTALIQAQQQAQLIAQQNLLARQSQAAQAQNEMILMAQHNLSAMFSAPPSPLSPGGVGKTPPGTAVGPPSMQLMPHLFPTHAPFMMFPPRLPLTLPGRASYAPHLLQSAQSPGATAGMMPLMQHVAMKRSYGDAFQEQASSAKRAYVPHTAASATVGATANTLPVYSHYYPQI